MRESDSSFSIKAGLLPTVGDVAAWNGALLLTLLLRDTVDSPTSPPLPPAVRERFEDILIFLFFFVCKFFGLTLISAF